MIYESNQNNSERPLVYVTTVDSLTPIEGADRIETARVRNWDVVVGKGEFKVGDKVAYFEIDTALPENDPRYVKFADRGTKTLPNGMKAHVLRTIKLRNQVSQGLIMSLPDLGITEAYEVDTDLTHWVNVYKWEPPVKGEPGTMKGNFPTQFADKTDAERIQNLSPKQWAEVKQHEWYATEKVDGSSITIINEGGEFRYASRNWEVSEDSKFGIAAQSITRFIPEGYTVQGEFYGNGINGNRLQLAGTGITVFNVWKDREKVPFDEWPEVLKSLSVPVLDLTLPDTIEEAIAQADKMKSQINPRVMAEGIVWHTVDGSNLTSLGDSKFKVINNSYLLKE